MVPDGNKAKGLSSVNHTTKKQFNSPDRITSIYIFFADDTSLFSKLLDVNESVKKLNVDLEINSECAFNGKCSLILIPINKLMKL